MMMMTQEQHPVVAAEPARKTRAPRAVLVVVASVVALAALLVAAAVWTTQPPSPRVVPTRVLVDGGRGQGEVVATIEADYQEPPSWHAVGVEGGSCEITAKCAAGASCPVLRAAVRRPRQLAEGRVAIDAVVTELWPERARKALEADGAISCTFSAYVDVLKTGWRVEREVRWGLANAASQTTVSVTPQRVTPKVQNGTLVVDGSYVFEAQLAAGSALGELLRSVPVLVRAEFGYVEQQEGALHAGLHMDAELNVTTQVTTGKTVVSMPFATSSSASLKALAKYMVAVGKSAPEETTAGDLSGVRLHDLSFAAAPHAPATASLFGGSHQVAWSRNFSFSERRRLDGRRLSMLPQDISLLHQFRIDEQEVLEVLVAVSGAEPAEAMLRVRSAAAFTGTYTDVLTLSMRMDQLLEPSVAMGSGSGVATPMGDIKTTVSGSSELMTWKGEGDMSNISATLERTGEDFKLDLMLPEGMVGKLEMKAGALTGSLTSRGVALGTLKGQVTDVETADADQRVDVTVKVDQETMVLDATIKAAEHFGGSLKGSLTYGNGTAIGSADVKLEAVASGDAKGHVKVTMGAEPNPLIDGTLSLTTTEPTCGRLQVAAKMSGAQVFSADVGCKRTVGSEDFEASALVKTTESEPTLVDASVGFVSKAPFGGDLKAQAKAMGETIFNVDVKAEEVGDSRTVDGKLTLPSDPTVQRVVLTFSKPGVQDVTVTGSLFANATEMGKATIAGKAIEAVVATQDVGTRREFVVIGDGAWSVSVSMPNEGGALQEMGKGTVTLTQAANIVTVKVDAPSMLTVTVTADSSSADSLGLATTVVAFEDGKSMEVATLGGTMTHAGDLSSGTLTLKAGELTQAMDLTVSRGFLLQPDSTYKMSMSAKVMIPEADMGIQVDDLYVQTYADGGMMGVGWDAHMMDAKGAMALRESVDIAMAPPAVDEAEAVKVTGSMAVEVQGDVAAFIADPAVKKGFQSAIAETVGVPSNRVKVVLSAARRLSEIRRLAGSVTVNYEILLPEGADSSAASAAMTSAAPADLTTKVMTVVKEESGGVDPYNLTVKEVAPVKVTKGGEEVPVSRASGAGGALPLALLVVVAGTALSA